MGRWRPPPPKSSPYITAEGYASMQQELKDAWVRRRDVVRALAAAAAEGDRSENAEYIYRKKELGGIDRRIRYLQKRLPDLNIVRANPNPDKIFFGAWVDLIDDAGESVRYRIVGADEADADPAYISIDSPLAQALLKKSVDDEVQIRIADQLTRYAINKIDYEAAE